MSGARSTIRHGLVWLGAASAIVRVIGLVSNIVVLWFLTLEEVGAASLAWSVAVFLEAFNGLGVGVALVQAPSVERRQIHGLVWFSIGLGALLTSAVAAVSPWIATLFEAPQLAPLIAVSALRLLFMSGALIPLQLLNRKLRFEQLAAITAAAALGAAVLKITLAILGFGAWSMVLGHTAEGLLTVVLVYILAPVWPRLSFAFAELKQFIVFGAKAAASTVIYHGYRNLDFFIVGRVFGPVVLGAYRVAFDLSMIPLTAVMDVANRAALPTYSRIGADDRVQLGNVFLWLVRNLMLLSAPVAVALWLCGPQILAVAAGERWASAGPFMGILAGAALLRVMDQVFPTLFHASGRPALAAYDSALTAAVFCGAAAGMWWLAGDTLGARAIAAAWVVTYVIMVLVLQRMARNVIDLSLGRYLATLGHPALLLVLAAAAGFGAKQLARQAVVAPLGSLALQLATVAIVAIVYVRWGAGVRVSELWPKRASREVSADPPTPPVAPN